MVVGGAGGYRLLIEDGGGGSTGVGGETRRRALFSATSTLTLAILGSSVLPVPYAFSRLGVLPGLGVMLLVALSNAVAGTLLLRAAASLDKHTFEGLAEAVGGRSWKVCVVWSGSSAVSHARCLRSMQNFAVVVGLLNGTTGLKAACTMHLLILLLQSASLPTPRPCLSPPPHSNTQPRILSAARPAAAGNGDLPGAAAVRQPHRGLLPAG
jgi:hypothetical protein